MTEAILHRYIDDSGVSGTGTVGEIFEASDGAVAIRWRGDRASWGLWGDIRDLEAIHGHGGHSVVEYLEPHRLLAAYQRVVPWLLTGEVRPVTVGPHPDHLDRLRLTFKTERIWSFWVALLEGSTHAAVHEEVNGEIEHRWTSPDGNVWCVYYSPLTSDDPLETFDREDRG